MWAITVAGRSICINPLVLTDIPDAEPARQWFGKYAAAAKERLHYGPLNRLDASET